MGPEPLHRIPGREVQQKGLLPAIRDADRRRGVTAKDLAQGGGGGTFAEPLPDRGAGVGVVLRFQSGVRA